MKSVVCFLIVFFILNCASQKNSSKIGLSSSHFHQQDTHVEDEETIYLSGKQRIYFFSTDLDRLTSLVGSVCTQAGRTCKQILDEERESLGLVGLGGIVKKIKNFSKVGNHSSLSKNVPPSVKKSQLLKTDESTILEMSQPDFEKFIDDIDSHISDISQLSKAEKSKYMNILAAITQKKYLVKKEKYLNINEKTIRSMSDFEYNFFVKDFKKYLDPIGDQEKYDEILGFRFCNCNSFFKTQKLLVLCKSFTCMHDQLHKLAKSYKRA